MSRLAVAGVTVVVTLAVLWFGVSWLVFNSPPLDALGEMAGGVLLLLVVVSVVGAVRRGSVR